MNLNHIKLSLLLAMSVFFTLNLSRSIAQSYIVTDKTKLAQLKAAVEAKPEDFDTHFAYIRAMGFDSPDLIKQYETWVKKYPRSKMFPYAIGEFLTRRANAKARDFLLKALAIDSNYAVAWNAMASDAELRGDFEASGNYMAKAAAAAPDNVDYAFQNAFKFATKDFKKYKEMTLDFVSRFHEHQRAAQALYWLAYHTNDVNEKIQYFERMRKEFPATRFNWTSGGMSDYFGILIVSDPAKAITLAEEMVAVKDSGKEWGTLLGAAKEIVKARKLMDERKGAEAISVLGRIKLPKRSSVQKNLVLWKAQASHIAGHTNAAYDSLMVTFIKGPSPQLKEKIIFYGKKIGKDTQQVEIDIHKQLGALIKPATTFNLKNYLAGGNTSLEDYRGKVVLLTYWYPACGPCRAEFPHFENVVRKFKGQDLVYVGINIYPKQSDYVVPFVKGSGYSFVPLEDIKDRAKGNLDNRGIAPVNFLIDKDGNLVFSNFNTGSGNEDELELMINMLLKNNKS